MTTTRHAPAEDPGTRQLREELARAKAAAHEAIDRNDPAQAIAFMRALRSLLWRAEKDGIALDTNRDGGTQ